MTISINKDLLKVANFEYNEDFYLALYDLFDRHPEYSYLGRGSFRWAFTRRNSVIKIPSCYDGFIDNIMEAMAWRVYKNNPTRGGILLAPCRLLPNGCLIMAKVCRTFYPDDVEPGWDTTIIDNDQVGLHKGKVVAFDYALDLVERHEWQHLLNLSSDFFDNEYSLREGNDHVNIWEDDSIECEE